jgi:CRP/FNR family nitrogen fixation transcriptional regulator
MWETAMQTGMQAVRHTHHARGSSAPHCTTPDALDLLEQFGSTVTVRRRREIYGQGQPAAYCWRIVSGCACIATLTNDGRRQVSEVLWPGNLFGMDDLGTYASAAEAVTDVTLRRYPRRMVEALAQSHAAVACQFRSMALASIRHTYGQMIRLGRETGTKRVVSFLLDMVHCANETDCRFIDLPMSRVDIADYLVMSTETVCRILAHLQREGIVTIVPIGLELHDSVALHELACELHD